jgi:hypothetical protein
MMGAAALFGGLCWLFIRPRSSTELDRVSILRNQPFDDEVLTKDGWNKVYTVRTYRLAARPDDVYKSVRADMQGTKWKESNPVLVHHKGRAIGVVHEFNLGTPKPYISLQINPAANQANKTTVFLVLHTFRIAPFW